MNSALVVLLNCCRCCLNQITNENIVFINDTIRINFLELTGTELIDDPDNFSSILCEKCFNKLNEFSQFRSDLIDSQKSLYDCKEGYVEILFDNDDTNNEIEELIETIDDEKIECLVEEIDGTIVRTEICEVSFYDRQEIVENKGNKKGCHLCGSKISESGLYHHIKRVHKIGRTYDCDICGKTCRLKNDLVLHMKRHLNIESRDKYPCLLCSSEFLSKGALKNHNSVVHQEFIEEHPCDYEDCNKSFKTHMKLLQHKKAVHEGGKYLCGICDKFYSTKQYLQKHINQCHTEKIMIACEICGKSFPKGIQFKRHSIIHEEKRFRCEYENCEKEFQFKGSLSKHIETHHLSSQSVTCDHCGYSFPTYRHLNRHILRQHNEVKIKCEIDGCKQMFGRKDYLIGHYKTHHKDIDEDSKRNLLEKIKNIKTISW